MLDNNKLLETILCINDEEHGEIIIINLQFISKPVLAANGGIDYKNINTKLKKSYDCIIVKNFKRN